MPQPPLLTRRGLRSPIWLRPRRAVSLCLCGSRLQSTEFRKVLKHRPASFPIQNPRRYGQDDAATDIEKKTECRVATVWLSFDKQLISSYLWGMQSRNYVCVSRLSTICGGLNAVEFRIRAAFGHELFVRTRFDNA